MIIKKCLQNCEGTKLIIVPRRCEIEKGDYVQLIKINDTAEVQIAKPDPSAKLESNQDVKSKEP